MASDLTDALEKLALQAEQADDSAKSSSLSKYFGQPDPSDDIFDVIAKPTRPVFEEPDTNIIENTASQVRRETYFSVEPAIAYQKGPEDSEPKIFSYFSQPSSKSTFANKNEEATEFFDHISEMALLSHKPIEISTPNTLHPPTEASSQEDRQESESFPNSNANSTSSNTTFVQPLIESANSSLYSSGNVVINNRSKQNTDFPLLESANSPVVDGICSEISSELERASGWWISSQKSFDSLNSLKDKEKYESFRRTCPGLSSNIELTDPLKELLRHFDGETAANQRRSLTADHVTQDDQGIEDLIKANSFRAAANLCGRLLTAYGQGFGKAGHPTVHTPHSLKLWFIRISLLYRCRLYEIAQSEVSAFGDFDSPDLFYEFYPDLKKRGTMIPFTLRLIAAMLPAHLSLFREAYAKLCHLLSNVRRIIKDAPIFGASEKLSETELKAAIELWLNRESQVESCLIDCALIKKDYHNAIQLIRKQITRSTSSSNPGLYAKLGRIFLLVGDVMSAQRAFNRAADLRNTSIPSDTIASLMDAGMIAIAQNAFAEAHRYFQKALALQPDSPMVVNNIAVCLLYMGCMRDAMLLLEENLGTNPECMIQDYTVLNVCTLYELESSLTAQRKLGMLRLASQWRTDNLDVSSFKLSIT